MDSPTGLVGIVSIVGMVQVLVRTPILSDHVLLFAAVVHLF